MIKRDRGTSPRSERFQHLEARREERTYSIVWPEQKKNALCSR